MFHDLSPGEEALGWSLLVQGEGLTEAWCGLIERRERCSCLGKGEAVLRRFVHRRVLVSQVGRGSFEASLSLFACINAGVP